MESELMINKVDFCFESLIAKAGTTWDIAWEIAAMMLSVLSFLVSFEVSFFHKCLVSNAYAAREIAWERIVSISRNVVFTLVVFEVLHCCDCPASNKRAARHIARELTLTMCLLVTYSNSFECECLFANVGAARDVTREDATTVHPVLGLLVVPKLNSRWECLLANLLAIRLETWEGFPMLLLGLVACKVL
eukprot:gnl/MRDRNA2_/MRDRNA2_52360_c0_seq1.p1 gnl/MRDRNA2_/MRDRNA2_52360_c0~~gnl/MRDRNA2_/MRDRNA2_52360_c0_seq1.p1  ORF type:complete len:191 (-),score=10.45 gnl/MRDRNA2_/MRDRNA2_52360_c0_seq1:49-621(-)